MQTPLVYGDLLYGCRDSGIMACYDAKTGTKQYRKRLAQNEMNGKSRDYTYFR